jgi:pyruvate formate-lyase activating enzyme-like uncharacterized protein
MEPIPTISHGADYLQRIRRTIAAKPLAPTNTRHLEGIWAHHLERVRGRLPGAVIEDGGQILHTGKISPGCRACKEGAWDCVFTTPRCNLKCPFCTLPLHRSTDWHGAAYGHSPGQFIDNIARTSIRGVGFTGGEALLRPRRLHRWIKTIKGARPDIYLWIYTNGLLCTSDQIKALGQLGVDEIRFNMAATGYNHPEVLTRLEQAAQILPAATVEIPAIPGHAERLHNCLGAWSSAGATYLNLHELMREPDSPSKDLNGRFFPWITPDGHSTDLHLQSRSLVLAVMERVTHEKIPLWVNDCSSQSKLRQISGRRRRLLPLVKQPYEKLEQDHFLSHLCALDASHTARLIHPDNRAGSTRLQQDHRWYKIERTAPLSLHEPSRWTRLTALQTAGSYPRHGSLR